jgi:hypothetical protein
MRRCLPRARTHHPPQLTRSPARCPRRRLALKLLGHQTGAPGARAMGKATCTGPEELRAAELHICRALDWDLLAHADIVSPGGFTPCDAW